MLNNFLKTIFDETEYTCFSLNNKGTSVYPIENFKNDLNYNFFSINPLDPLVDHNPTQSYHNVNKPRRADHNVVCYRNILLEMDNIPLDTQLNIVNELNLPFTSATYSGGKSIHFIISLQEPLQSKKEYDELVYNIYKAINRDEPLIDESCKNPSRLSRLPFSTRSDTGKKQHLIELRDRIDTYTLTTWIKSRIDIKNESNKEIKWVYPSSNSFNRFTLNFLINGAKEGERNKSVYRVACNFNELNLDKDYAFECISSVTDLPEEEIIRTINSAYSRKIITG